jgi:hypothetical protein
MNVRQGLFRLWLVLSTLFIIFVGVAYYGLIREEFRIANTDWDAFYKEYGGTSLLPTTCDKARGSLGRDYTKTQGLCWYTPEDFRRLYPEYNDLSDRSLAEKLYARVGQPLQHAHPWRKVLEGAALAFGFPLAVLALGRSMFWAVAGFRSSAK